MPPRPYLGPKATWSPLPMTREITTSPSPETFSHGLNGVEPRAFAGQLADDNAPPSCPPLALLMVVTPPAPYGGTAVPRGVVPDQPQRREALHRQAGRAPGQEIARDRTDG